MGHTWESVLVNDVRHAVETACKEAEKAFVDFLASIRQAYRLANVPSELIDPIVKSLKAVVPKKVGCGKGKDVDDGEVARR